MDFWFRLLKNKTLKIFSIQERRKSRRKFGGTKVCKAEKVRKYFVNPKTKIEVFSHIFCSLDFKNISCTLILLHVKTNDEWCRFLIHIGSPSLLTSPLVHIGSQLVLHFIFLRVFCFFLVFSSFLSFFCGLYYLLRYSGKFGNT